MRIKFNLRKLVTIFHIKSFIFLIIVVWPKFGKTREIEIYPEINSSLIVSKSVVSIAFTSQNQKSPSSMFGHTFLIFHNATPPEPDSIVTEYFGDTSKSFWVNVQAVVFSVPGSFRYSYFYFQQK